MTGLICKIRLGLSAGHELFRTFVRIARENFLEKYTQERIVKESCIDRELSIDIQRKQNNKESICKAVSNRIEVICFDPQFDFNFPDTLLSEPLSKLKLVLGTFLL